MSIMKRFIYSILLLLILGLSHVQSRVCRTQEGVAWCEGNFCYYRSGSTFTANYCSVENPDGVATFNGSNCRKCPLTSCSIVTSLFTGKLNFYHSSGGYLLTDMGWCYYG
jgi:hypothetical protein